MKKEVFWVVSVLCCLLFLTGKCVAEERSIRSEDMCLNDRSGGTMSIAVTDQYAVYAKGTFSDEYDLEWCPNKFTVSIEDLSIGEEAEIATFPSSWVCVVSDGQKFFVIESNFLNEYYEKPVSIRIGVIEPEARLLNWHESIMVDENEYEILDVQLIQSRLYLICTNHIVEYETSTGNSSIIFESTYGFDNDLYENHSQIFENKLIVQTEGWLKSIDVTTAEVKNLVAVDTTDEWTSYIDCRASNAYYVVGNELIYPSLNEMNVLNLLTGHKYMLISERFKILHMSAEGFCVDLYDNKYGLYMYSPELDLISTDPLENFCMRDFLVNWVRVSR